MASDWWIYRAELSHWLIKIKHSEGLSLCSVVKCDENLGYRTCFTRYNERKLNGLFLGYKVYSDLGTRYFFPGSLIAKPLLFFHGLLLLKRYFFEFAKPLIKMPKMGRGTTKESRGCKNIRAF